MAVATAIGLGLGYWVDLQLETYPWLSILGLLIGVSAGFLGVFRAAKEAQEVMGDKKPQVASETRDDTTESKK